LAKQLGVKNIQQSKQIGQDLGSLEVFRDEQLVQLHELFQAAKGKADGASEKK